MNSEQNAAQRPDSDDALGQPGGISEREACPPFAASGEARRKVTPTDRLSGRGTSVLRPRFRTFARVARGRHEWWGTGAEKGTSEYQFAARLRGVGASWTHPPADVPNFGP